MNENNKVQVDEVDKDNSPNQPTSVIESKLPAVKDNSRTGNISLSNINLFDDKQLLAAENFLTKIMRSDKGGIKTINEGLAILMRAQDLNLPFSTCIEHIHVINGKTGVDIHIIKALLLRAGVTWRCTKDYTPLYEYTDGINVYNENALPDYVIKCKSVVDANNRLKENPETENVYIYPVKWYSDFSGNIYRDYQLTTAKHVVVSNIAEGQNAAKNGKIGVYRIPNKPIDYIAEYEMFRVINGKEMSSIGTFTYSDAVIADMLTKDTYKKYPKVLIKHRAFTYAARDIASDILFGVMETTELKIVAGKELNDADIIDIEAEEIRD